MVLVPALDLSPIGYSDFSFRSIVAAIGQFWDFNPARPARLAVGLDDGWVAPRHESVFHHPSMLPSQIRVYVLPAPPSSVPPSKDMRRRDDAELVAANADHIAGA